MLAVLIRTGEVVAVVAAVALAAGAAGVWWLRRKARRLLAEQARQLVARAGHPGWAGLVPDRPQAVAAWRRQVVRAAWRRVRARAARQALPGRRRGTGVPGAR